RSVRFRQTSRAEHRHRSAAFHLIDDLSLTVVLEKARVLIVHVAIDAVLGNRSEHLAVTIERAGEARDGKRHRRLVAHGTRVRIPGLQTTEDVRVFLIAIVGSCPRTGAETIELLDLAEVP